MDRGQRRILEPSTKDEVMRDGNKAMHEMW